uniref:G-protein coupled receptors family 3 profile domain-containing protein n=1 Tax=Setaria digitata TaxID=48799 RepID=A0A915Q1W7_9BILA
MKFLEQNRSSGLRLEHMKEEHFMLTCDKYQIGATFPLHDEDCVKLHVEAVQDIVAVQWALTHWNQNTKSNNLKTGLYAGDTCSKPKEAISQTLKLLNSLGFYEPDECGTGDKNFLKLLGLFLPKDAPSARAIAALLQTTPLPLLAYSYEVADELTQMSLPNFVTTAPTLTVFIDAFIRLLKNLNSNLVAIVSKAEDKNLISRIVRKFQQENIFISEVISTENPNFEEIIRNSDSQIMFTVLSKIEVAKLLHVRSFGSGKLWVVLELERDEKRLQEFIVDPDVQVIYLRQQQRNLPQFKNYFLRVLKNNYQSYSLLGSLMQQMCNCTISNENDENDCSKVDAEKVALSFKQASTVESAIRAVYAFTAVATRLERKPETLASCAKPSGKCTQLIMMELESLIYEFDANDPVELFGTNLYFFWESNTTLMSNGIVIEGIEVIDNEQQLGPMEVKIMEYETGVKPRFAMIAPQSRKIHSTCAPYRPYCGQCTYTAQADQKRFYLSDSQPHQLYVIGFFDFHGGRTCQSYRNSDITLPLAFLYTLTTFSERYPHISLLRNLDLGAILVDSCSSGRMVIETVLLTKNHCFTIEQDRRNITVVPGSVIGYASALSGRVAEGLKGLFVSGDSLLISLDADHDVTIDSFSAVPSRKQETLALLKLLRKFAWDYISIVISEQEDSSLVTYREFEKQAAENGICIAEVKAVNGEEVDPTTITNVTILFTSASDAATYFAAKLRRESPYPHVHIVIGDAHDFYLRDPSNVARFAGTISLQPKDVIHGEFRTWLEGITPLNLPELWYWEYVENRWQCALSEANRNFYENRMCTGDELLDLPSLGRMTKSAYFARGLERFLFAVDAIYKRLCPEQIGVCNEFYIKGHEQISKILRKAHTEHDFEIYEFMADGQGSYSYQNIGNYSAESGFKFSVPYKYFGVFGHLSDEIPQLKIISRCISPSCRCFLDVKSMKMSYSIFDEPGAFTGSYIRRVPTNDAFQQLQFPSILDRLTAGQWRLQTRNYALAAVITVMLIGALGVLFLAAVKLYFRVIKGNQSLGLSLLLGVIVLYITGYVFVFESTDTICRLRIVLHPVGYAFCFGIMIIKAIQMKNAESLGFVDVVYISYWNYWLLLVFITAVQIALSLKWLTEEFASVVVLDDLQPRLVCKYENNEFLMSQAYVIILLLLALYLNSTNKNIKRNHKDTVIVLELLLCASVLLGFIFGPKIYIMLSYEPVVVEVHPQQATKDFILENDLFEKEDLKRTSSLSNSVELHKSRSTCSSVNCKNSSANRGLDDNNDDQVPIFRTVMRKKNRLGRSHSADRQRFSRIIQQSTFSTKVLFSDGKKKNVMEKISVMEKNGKKENGDKLNRHRAVSSFLTQVEGSN